MADKGVLNITSSKGINHYSSFNGWKGFTGGFPMGSRRDADLAHVLTCYKEMTKFWAFFPSFRLQIR